MMKKKLIAILELLYSKRKQLKLRDRNAIYWSFYCVNDNGKMTLHDAPQIIHYILFLLLQAYVFF
jgi:hypothetical protein